MRRTLTVYGGTVVIAVAVFVLITLGVTGGSRDLQAASGPTSERAKEVATKQTGKSADGLTVIRVAPFEDTGIRQFKFADDTGNIVGVNLDAVGNPVTPDEIKNHGRRANERGFHGKFEAELQALLKGKPDSPVRFVCLLEVPADSPRRGPGVTEQEYENHLQLLASQISSRTAPVWDKVRALGGTVHYTSDHVPFGVCEGNPKLIREIAKDRRVKRIYLERVHQERLNVSRIVVQANTVNALGLTGVGRTVGVVESGRIAAHVNLPAGQRITCTPTFFSLFAGVSGHKTNVAGVIQSTNGVSRGLAPGITVVDGVGANFSDAEMTAATDCVIANGASAINMSFGTETNGTFGAFARFVDAKVYQTGRTIVPAISNICANRMGTPEIAFNVLATGAFGDNNTTAFFGDVAGCTGVVTFSTVLDPISPSGDRQEPDVVAPGHLISTTTSAGGFASVNGTSFAAPHVTAGVGLLTQRDPSLHFQAERVRAIMMASARHNIEGAARLSERDGAGGIMLAAADRILLSNLSSFFSRPGGTEGFPINRVFTATAGQRVRVAIAWSHKSPGGDTLTRPTTDLDLTVFSPTGAALVSSASFDNSYEIVEFIAPVTGSYTARISNFRSSAGTEFIGFAASRTDL